MEDLPLKRLPSSISALIFKPSWSFSIKRAVHLDPSSIVDLIMLEQGIDSGDKGHPPLDGANIHGLEPLNKTLGENTV